MKSTHLTNLETTNENCETINSIVFPHIYIILRGLMVRMLGYHANGPGSIPGNNKNLFFNIRQREDFDRGFVDLYKNGG